MKQDNQVRSRACQGFLVLFGVAFFFTAAAQNHSETAPARAKSFHGLVVLIDFVDQPANVSLSRADNIINGIDYTEPTVTRSLGDYWYEQSRGKVVLTHDVIGYFRAPQTAAWYDMQPEPFEAYIMLLRQAMDWVVATNPSYDWDALSLANGAMNRNGTEDGTFLSVAFMTTAWITGTGGTHWLPDWTAPNGVTTQQVVGATFISPWDSDVNLFWLTHEQGHSIWGWPDTYDTTGNSHGTGLYSLMSGNQSTGDIEPVGALFLSAERWVRTKEIRRNQTINLEPDGNAVARYKNPNDPLEYFLIEARTNSTTGNSAFPAPLGLLIWHVDENVATDNTLPHMTPAEHYFVSVEQADGHFDLELNINTGDLGDVYLPGLTFDELSMPNSNWWDGSPSRLRIDGVRFLNNHRIMFRASTR